MESASITMMNSSFGFISCATASAASDAARRSLLFGGKHLTATSYDDLILDNSKVCSDSSEDRGPHHVCDMKWVPLQMHALKGCKG